MIILIPIFYKLHRPEFMCLQLFIFSSNKFIFYKTIYVI